MGHLVSVYTRLSVQTLSLSIGAGLARGHGVERVVARLQCCARAQLGLDDHVSRALDPARGRHAVESRARAVRAAAALALLRWRWQRALGKLQGHGHCSGELGGTEGGVVVRQVADGLTHSDAEGAAACRLQRRAASAAAARRVHGIRQHAHLQQRARVCVCVCTRTCCVHAQA